MFRLIDESSGYLFASRNLREFLEQRTAAMCQEVEQLAPDRLLNTSPSDLVQYLVEKYKFDPPTLRREDWVADERETQVDVSHDRLRYIEDRNHPFYVPGQRIEVVVPFDGDPELMHTQPSRFSSYHPRARVQGQSLVLAFDVAHDDQVEIRQDIDRILADIEQYLGWVQNDVDRFNKGIQLDAEQAIERRRTIILANRGRVASLGIPIKSRPDAPKTYALPTVRRKVVPVVPPASAAPYEPEPVLDIYNYNHILSVIQSMAHVMERSPSAFKAMGEEGLRQHFLVQLNGQFEGNATGETFNVGGKTDILLRESGRNVFIAECKFWKGPKNFRDTIDQLLGYTAWRDTKTAIIVFNRGTGLSAVLSGINSEATGHPNYKRTLDWKHETGFRYTFHHTSDVNREFMLTVLVFDVPSD